MKSENLFFKAEFIKEMVPSEGVEPPCLAALGSKPSVSANSTNWARDKIRIDG